MSINYKTMPDGNRDTCIAIGVFFDERPSALEVCQWRGEFILVDAYEQIAIREELADSAVTSKTILGAKIVSVMGCVLGAVSESMPELAGVLEPIAKSVLYQMVKDEDVPELYEKWKAHNTNVPADISDTTLLALFCLNILDSAYAEIKDRSRGRTLH